jgi:hypothetical protein
MWRRTASTSVGKSRLRGRFAHLSKPPSTDCAQLGERRDRAIAPGVEIAVGPFGSMLPFCLDRRASLSTARGSSSLRLDQHVTGMRDTLVGVGKRGPLKMPDIADDILKTKARHYATPNREPPPCGLNSNSTAGDGPSNASGPIATRTGPGRGCYPISRRTNSGSETRIRAPRCGLVFAPFLRRTTMSDEHSRSFFVEKMSPDQRDTLSRERKRVGTKRQ